MQGLVSVASVSIADTMGIFTGDTASCLSVRAGWQTGILGSGMVLCITSLANGQSLMPQVLSWGRSRDLVQRQWCLAFTHFEVLSSQTLSS